MKHPQKKKQKTCFSHSNNKKKKPKTNHQQNGIDFENNPQKRASI